VTNTLNTEVRELGIFIDGEWTRGESGALTDILNPATEETVARVVAGTRGDAQRAISAARRAFDTGPWPRMSVEERRAVMGKMVDLLDRRREELVEVNMKSVGTLRWLAEAVHVDAAITHLRDMVDRVMPRFEWERPTAPHFGRGIGQGLVLREPFGVASLISAYNVPLYISLAKVAPALAAGCTAVLKPAPTAPLEALILAEIADEAGLPPGVLNVVTGDVDVSTEMTVNPMVDLVSFTGSDAVGKLINAQAAPTLKKVVLELGGKSPHIILDDADVASAAATVVAQTTLNTGQGCNLLTRTLVHNSLKSDLVEAIKEGFAQVVVGDPVDAATTMGPLISAAQRHRVKEMIDNGVAEGARLVSGGQRPEQLDRGFFIAPTLFDNVDNAMSVAQKEFFGPVNVVIGFDDDDEAVRIANDSEFGLWAAVRSGDPIRAYALGRQLRSGSVEINGGGGAFPNTYQPYGGYKNSGMGREYGEAGLDEYLESKSVIWGVASA
jgi:acyl-CoA reductase-like NAD-dependent aldehyde dehydrogenase